MISFFDEYMDYYKPEEPHYIFNGHPVPRTTEILSAMLHEQFLMEWSNRVGLYGHKDYNDILDKASYIGSNTHKYIENYLIENALPTEGNLPFTIEPYVFNTFNSFLKWWDKLNKKHIVKIIFTERPLVCNLFGGTLDLLLNIDGENVLIDFKTSNHPSYKYFLQLSSYRFILRLEGINVDKCTVLMLNKNHISYKELKLDFTINEHLIFMNECEKTFLNLAQAYLQRLYIEYNYRQFFG